VAQPFDGWTIQYGFHKADWEDWIIDPDESEEEIDRLFVKYVECLGECLEAAFPGARVDLDWDENTTGVLPFHLKPLGYSRDGSEEVEEWEILHAVNAANERFIDWIEEEG
jgi:hypothetical protein